MYVAGVSGGIGVEEARVEIRFRGARPEIGEDQYLRHRCFGELLERAEDIFLPPSLPSPYGGWLPALLTSR
ncbi:hypothetical protein SAMN04489718_0593 [Actinopolyspora saharensis]|uniref:Uncharacterized protein n=1 Tax=Actinopolyspora saharensis TaxID=995062 RepID=A0A1H0YP75_9ACTN|nr:hypothetical protein SAMN04489718_0593 [Actinopolyspora saharensis]